MCIIFFQTGKHGGLKLNRYFIIIFLFERLIPCNIVFFGFGSSTIFCFVLFSSLFPRVGGVHGKKDRKLTAKFKFLKTVTHSFKPDRAFEILSKSSEQVQYRGVLYNGHDK